MNVPFFLRDESLNAAFLEQSAAAGLAAAASAAAGTGAFIAPAWGAPPEAQKITPVLIEAAKKEGKLSWYTSVDLALAEKVANAFEAKYPGVKVKVERSGAERNYQRIGQEYISPPLVHRRFSPRSRPIGVLGPMVRSNSSP